MYRFVGTALAARGFVAAIPDYRVYPEVRFPGFVEDAARAVRWVRDDRRPMAATPARLVLAGHSAGAHIAAMLALDPQWLRASRHGPAAATCAGCSGSPVPTTSCRSIRMRSRTIFGPETGAARRSRSTSPPPARRRRC